MGTVSEHSERLYTVADLVEIVESTNTKVKYWIEHADETYVPPRYKAGRNNNHGHFMMFLWAEDQIDQVVASFEIFERKKEARLQIAKENATADPTRKEYYREYRKKQREAIDKKTKEDLAELAERLKPKPKPIPQKPLAYRPPGVEVEDDWIAEDDRDREERAFQFLINKGI